MSKMEPFLALAWAIRAEVCYQQIIEAHKDVTREDFVNVMCMSSVDEMVMHANLRCIVASAVDQLASQHLKESKRLN